MVVNRQLLLLPVEGGELKHRRPLLIPGPAGETRTIDPNLLTAGEGLLSKVRTPPKLLLRPDLAPQIYVRRPTNRLPTFQATISREIRAIRL